MVDFKDVFEADGGQLTVELEIESEYGTTTQRQTVNTSDGDTITIEISED